MTRLRPVALASLAVLLAAATGAQAPADYANIRTIPGVRVDQRYATTNNFMGVNLYGDFHEALLHQIAAAKLAKAAALLQQQRPGWSLLVFDALRPRSVQRLFWAKVKGTPMQIYVADPDAGSVHNFGFAVDLSLADANGKEVDMGTPFDSFDSLAQPQVEARYRREGKLTEAQLANRVLLREVMQGAGFIQLPVEWWHYDALPKEEVVAHYTIVETFPLSSRP